MSVRDVTQGVAGDVVLASDGVIYLGDPNTDGTWRIIIDGTDLRFERLESSTWVPKGAFNP